jgi:hypothetical protein
MTLPEKLANWFFAFVVIFLSWHVVVAWLRGAFEVSR